MTTVTDERLRELAKLIRHMSTTIGISNVTCTLANIEADWLDELAQSRRRSDRDGMDIDAIIKRACGFEGADIHLVCTYPKCNCKKFPRAIRAALSLPGDGGEEKISMPTRPDRPASEEPTVHHASDCAVHNAPAYPPGECDCGALLSKR